MRSAVPREAASGEEAIAEGSAPAVTDLFVSGRVCLLGEHCDWAGGHRTANPAIPVGVCLLYGTDCGLRARAWRTLERTFEFRSCAAEVDGAPVAFTAPLDAATLAAAAAGGGFYAYVCGAAAALLQHCERHGLRPSATATTASERNAVTANTGGADPVARGGGIAIDNYLVDLPVRKGVSSSAAAGVLVVAAFDRTWGLGLSVDVTMDIAYRGERLAGSQCGRLDFGCVFGRRLVRMTFDGDDVVAEPLPPCPVPFHFVVCDLGATKDTRAILSSLNACYPAATTAIDAGVHHFFGSLSAAHVASAIAAMTAGDPVALGACLTAAQADFDACVAPACPGELAAPRLHAVLADPDVQRLACGGKGVGSQGDGSAQFVCATAAAQAALAAVLRGPLGCPAVFCFTL